MKTLFALCEGQHDAQFVGRILLESSRFEAYEEKLMNYPRPLGQFIKQRLERNDVDEVRVGRPNPTLLPARVLKKIDADELVVLIPTGGKYKHAAVIDLVKAITESFAPEMLDRPEYNVSDMAILFLQDANAMGVGGTVDLFIEKYSESLGAEDNLNGFRCGEWRMFRRAKAALLVFTGDDGQMGTLEDSLISLFETGNQRLFRASDDFARDNFEAKPESADKGAYASKKNKAILTCCGQMEKDNAGSSLAVVIKNTKLLDGAFDLERDSQWNKLLDLVNHAFSV